MVDYKKRFVEVDEILDYLGIEDYEKIPQEIIKVIKQNKDEEYNWEYDETRALKDQNVSKDTIALISYLNMEYLLNEKQKEYVQNQHNINKQKKLQKEYSNNEDKDYRVIFDKKNSQFKENKVEINDLIEYKEGFLKKIINKIKSIFIG